MDKCERSSHPPLLLVWWQWHPALVFCWRRLSKTNHSWEFDGVRGSAGWGIRWKGSGCTGPVRGSLGLMQAYGELDATRLRVQYRTNKYSVLRTDRRVLFETSAPNIQHIHVSFTFVSVHPLSEMTFVNKNNFAFNNIRRVLFLLDSATANHPSRLELLLSCQKPTGADSRVSGWCVTSPKTCIWFASVDLASRSCSWLIPLVGESPARSVQYSSHGGPERQLLTHQINCCPARPCFICQSVYERC